jgi:hypothetical protein
VQRLDAGKPIVDQRVCRVRYDNASAGCRCSSASS